jgi:hypothetical protein
MEIKEGIRPSGFDVWGVEIEHSALSHSLDGTFAALCWAGYGAELKKGIHNKTWMELWTQFFKLCWGIK